MLDTIAQMPLFFDFKEIKEELEDLNKEIKKTANKIRAKLKCEFKVLVMFNPGWWENG